VYASLGQNDLAIQDCDEAIRLDRKDAITYYNRGNAYLNLGQYFTAVQDYDKAIRRDPQYADAYFKRGFAYSHFTGSDPGEREFRAIQDYDEAIRLDPKLAAAYYYRGLAYKELGDIWPLLNLGHPDLDIAKAIEFGYDA